MSEQSQARPRPAVPSRTKRFVGRRVADVHGRRSDVALLEPVPGIQQLMTWLTPSFYIDLGRPCNSACLYCAVPPHEDAQGFTPLGRVPEMIEAGRAVGCDRSILIGGEPTIYPHLNEVLNQLRRAGLERDHIIMTNGLRLAKANVAKELFEAGVDTFHISVDTSDPAIYDRLSRSTGRHAMQGKGLEAALATGANVYIYTAVTAVNAPGLPALAEWIAARAETVGREMPPWILAVIKPIGDGEKYADQLLMRPDQAVSSVRAGLGRADQLGITAGFRNIQACLAPDLVNRNIDYYLDDFSVDVQTGLRVIYSHTEYWSKPSDACGQCAHQQLCTGIYRQMALRYGEQWWSPIEARGLRKDL
ncbi:MAG: hypothetical protein CMH53_08550 [Myxococcales bacterium]|nr:hypothetical protein [Myxococcales bacterium]